MFKKGNKCVFQGLLLKLLRADTLWFCPKCDWSQRQAFPADRQRTQDRICSQFPGETERAQDEK
eukprot:1626697-Amphidinium_carterae.1